MVTQTRRRVRRRVRPSCELAEWLSAIFNPFGPLRCSDIQKVLRTDAIPPSGRSCLRLSPHFCLIFTYTKQRALRHLDKPVKSKCIGFYPATDACPIMSRYLRWHRRATNCGSIQEETRSFWHWGFAHGWSHWTNQMGTGKLLRTCYQN